ncbi:hypothetical protein A3A64_03040 [Candidatus Gottesmanbacteria bacterium RIFCSPLOWO2_01_FULL_48_11]|uniref:Four helix bundle protein n=1 Tax=Candidatus Gottesmanbacteria bacterium RIFCSPLOWO2_01_FULL_48_11 TaxID=1798395 RepID=A0A1F6ASC2_9BACT|nr:MAG: hypothetical protein A3A64_03040 [Candidatus Gottesmanbacteria bacterium RIFCSPLOWO2_01_FULL_48_11]
MSFHDDKLWQEAYVAAIDTLEATDGQPGDLIDQVRKHAMMVLTEVAQAVGNRDRKLRDIKLHGVGNIIIALRSLLSLLWAREGFTDETFGKLDAAYEARAVKFPR